MYTNNLELHLETGIYIIVVAHNLSPLINQTPTTFSSYILAKNK